MEAPPPAPDTSPNPSTSEESKTPADSAAAREVLEQLRRELARAIARQSEHASAHGTNDAYGNVDEALRRRVVERRRALGNESLRAHAGPAWMLAQHRSSAAVRMEAQSGHDFLADALAAARIDDEEVESFLASTKKSYDETELSRAKIGATTEQERKQLVVQEEADLPRLLKEQADAASAARLSQEEARLALARKAHANLRQRRAEDAAAWRRADAAHDEQGALESVVAAGVVARRGGGSRQAEIARRAEATRTEAALDPLEMLMRDAPENPRPAMKALVGMIKEGPGNSGLTFDNGRLEIVDTGRLSAALRRHDRNDDLFSFHQNLRSYGFVRVGSLNSYDAPEGVKKVDHILFLRCIRGT